MTTPLQSNNHDNNNNELISYIMNLPKVDNIHESIQLFQILYQRYTPLEWLQPSNLFPLSNAIAHYRPDLISIGIRLNVQVNLFLRSLLKFDSTGSKVKDIGASIGCFGLTEDNAGVLSGLYVETEFEEIKTVKNHHNDDNTSNNIDNNSYYILNSSKNGSHKNWISQGISAEKIVFFARNKKNKKDIRLFLADMNNMNNNMNNNNNNNMNNINNNNNESSSSTLGIIHREQIHTIDITKTLDLAKISFDNVLLSQSCVLDRTIDLNSIELLNGIFYGRMMIAEAIPSSIMGLIDYLKNEIILKKRKKLLKLEHPIRLQAYEREIQELLKKMSDNRNDVLENNDILSINAFKIYGVERSLEIFEHLNKMFTTHVLSYPLKYHDLILNKVAEGDTSVLRMSLIHNVIKENGMLKMFWNGPFSYIQLFQIWQNPSSVVLNYKELSDRIVFPTLSKL